MQISFYVLNDRYAANTASSDNEAVLGFVCKLTQTVLKKSELSLVIVDDDADRLKLLDQRLWTFDPLSFIPHVLLPSTATPTTAVPQSIMPKSIVLESNDLEGKDLDSNAAQFSSDAAPYQDALSPPSSGNNQDIADLVDLAAPVVLTSQLPMGFDGVVLNLAASPLTLPQLSSSSDPASTEPIEIMGNFAYPERILEIIAPDASSKQQGRDKYRHYKAQGHSLKYFPID